MLTSPFVLTQVETTEPLWVEADALRLKQVRGGATTNYVGAFGVDRVSIGATISKTNSVCCWTLAHGMATTLPVSLCLILC